MRINHMILKHGPLLPACQPAYHTIHSKAEQKTNKHHDFATRSFAHSVHWALEEWRKIEVVCVIEFGWPISHYMEKYSKYVRRAYIECKAATKKIIIFGISSKY